MFLRRVLRLFAAIVIPPLVIFAGLYLLPDSVIELSGGGMPNLVFRADHDEQAELIAKHRAAQRAAIARPPAVTATDPFQYEPARPPRTDAPHTTAPTTVRAATGESDTNTDRTGRTSGPRRDGHYRERPLLASWPAGGLTPLWKQPSGAGYTVVRHCQRTRVHH